ncbi:eCIS core domain-containing protein [Actinophytocola sp.]|uniref:eCIS core domain-containing protein n=1 Tax=Actinophytocola sp. TaxID=1872138 RepID=UPI002ED05403
MRWPFRRKADGTSAGPAAGTEPTAGGDGHALAQAIAQPAGDVVRPPARQWATLPAITTTIPRTMPLTVGPAPVVPPLRLGERRGLAASVEVPVGTVTGLAQSVVRATVPAVPVASQGVELLPRPVVRRPVRTAPAEVAPLVDAVDEYVGEPRVPAEPYKAPGWLRFMPEWAKTSQAEEPALPPSGTPEMVIAEPPSFLPAELRTPKVDPPPRMAESVQPTTENPPPLRKRRPNLGQSRRLGLGAPISRPELVHESPPIVDGTVESPQEPPPPPAAPARVVAEPDPAPEPPPAPEPEPEPTPEPSVADREPAKPPEQREDRTPPSSGGQPTGDPPPAGPAPVGTTPAKPVAAVYRATAELRPAPRRRERPRGTVVERVPAALASEVRTRQHADVSEVPVYRGPKVSEAAKSRGARAFAAGGAVFLPDEAGSVDSPRARGLLAHELVHAAQQRTLGPRLPSPDSPLGQRLEAEAQAAERFYAGESAEPPPLIHAPMPAPASAPEPDLSVAAQLATELAPAPTQRLQPANGPFDQEEAAEVDRIATESARHVVAEWTNPALQQRNPQQQQHTTHGPAHTGAHGTAPGSATRPASRREQMIAAELVRLNSHLAAGAAPLTELPRDALARIDHQITAEAARRHGSHPSRHDQTAEPQEPRYEPGSAQAWMHAITGMDVHSDPAPPRRGGREPGLMDSWWSGSFRDDRPVAERVADRMGLIDRSTATQFDMDTWWETEEDAAGDPDDGDSEGRSSGSSLDLNNVDLDELATRLYDRLRSRLRLELLVDRERAGMLTDFR